MKQLRYYQEEAIDALYKFFAEHADGNPLIALPTGAGKSLVIASFLKTIFTYYTWRSHRIVIATHVMELIEQNFEELIEHWPTAPAGIYSAGLKRRDIAPITFCGIASVAGRYAEFGQVDLLIIDEAHLVSGKDDSQYQKFILGLLKANPSLRVIGLSATCYRLGMGALTEGGIFTHVAYDMTSRDKFNKLLAEGYLARLVPKSTGTLIDVSDVAVRGGEYVDKEVQQAADREEITRAALTETLQYAKSTNRRKWLIFTTGIDHTEHVTAMLSSEFGVPCASVHSKTSKEERKSNIAGLRSGQLTALVNANVLTTGFNVPDVDLIVVLRPTKSTVLWVQMLGRGTRPFYAEGFDLSTVEGRLDAIRHSVKSDCLVLDFAGNTRRLGPINDPVLPRKKGEKQGPSEAPFRVCPQCDTYNHATATHCVECGNEFPKLVRFGRTADSAELIKGDAVNEFPVVETFKVDRVTYATHMKPGKPTTLKVSYFCGLRLFREWVCLEHPGNIRHKAHKWWQQRTASEVPNSVEEAMARVNLLKTPAFVNVWTNTKYPEVKGYEFRPDGS